MKSILQSKKGEVGNLAPAIISLVLAATFLVLGLVVLQELRDTDIVTKANSATVVNESGRINVSSGAYTLLGASQPGFNGVAIITAINGTSGAVINSGHYTVSSTGVVTNATAVIYNTANITYSYNYGDEAYTAGSDTITGLGTFSDFWTIIVLAIVIAIVIGLLLAVFGRKQR